MAFEYARLLAMSKGRSAVLANLELTESDAACRKLASFLQLDNVTDKVLLVHGSEIRTGEWRIGVSLANGGHLEANEEKRSEVVV